MLEVGLMKLIGVSIGKWLSLSRTVVEFPERHDFDHTVVSESDDNSYLLGLSLSRTVEPS